MKAVQRLLQMWPQNACFVSWAMNYITNSAFIMLGLTFEGVAFELRWLWMMQPLNWDTACWVLLRFKANYFLWIGMWVTDCGWLKDGKDAPDASFKTGQMKDAKQSLPTKDPSSWDVLRLSLMTWQPISRLTRMHPSVSEAPCISHSLSTILLESILGFFKGIVHPKIKILSSFTHPNVVPNLYRFLSSKEDILKNVDNQTVFRSHWLHIYIYIYRQAD